ncbi:MAG: glycosyltransferase family 2 protein, partial [Gammaproteobacteria bacterium]|nr:glycosyltransferase family 2 protein [Gammaproteobacteria bacterium]
YLAKQNRYTTLQAEALHRAGRRANMFKLVLSPLFRFIKFYFLRLGFLDGVPGLVHIAIGCLNSFSKYAKLTELNRRR